MLVCDQFDIDLVLVIWCFQIVDIVIVGDYGDGCGVICWYFGVIVGIIYCD